MIEILHFLVRDYDLNCLKSKLYRSLTGLTKQWLFIHQTLSSQRNKRYEDDRIINEQIKY